MAETLDIGLDKLSVKNLANFYEMMGSKIATKTPKKDLLKKVYGTLTDTFIDTDSGMTRFNHEGKAYECVTSDLMDISMPVNDDGDKPDKDDPDDKGDKPDKDDDPDDNDDPDDEGIHINIMEAFLVIVSYFTSDFEYVLLF